MSVSPEDLETIRNAGVITDTRSYLFGEFKLPGVLTNDLANNREVIYNDAVAFPQKTISMSHVKRVKRGSGGSIRVLICSKWEYENSLNEELKNEILSMASKTTNLIQNESIF